MTVRFSAGQRGAIFGLRLAGQSIGTVAALMGTTPARITKELPKDWWREDAVMALPIVSKGRKASTPAAAQHEAA